MKEVKQRNVPEMDSPEYLAKKKHFERMITVYGKNAVSDLLHVHREWTIERILVDRDNRSEDIRKIVQTAQKRNIQVKEMTREQLTRISRNKDEDQGIVADVVGNIETDWNSWLQSAASTGRLIALDGVTNPVNVGMIIRSAAAAGVDGILIPDKGVPAMNQPLLIKASAGTVFGMKLYRCPELAGALELAKSSGFQIIGLSGDQNALNLLDHKPGKKAIYVLGNESVGLAEEVQQLCNSFCRIPMAKMVESLNVAAAATLLSYAIGTIRE